MSKSRLLTLFSLRMLIYQTWLFGIRFIFLIIVFAILSLNWHVAHNGELALRGSYALADDGDDDSDDDSDDDDNKSNNNNNNDRDNDDTGQSMNKGGGNQILRLFNKIIPKAKKATKNRADRASTNRSTTARLQFPTRVSNEIVASSLSEVQVTDLENLGFIIVERYQLALTNTEVFRLRIPQSTTLEAAREQLRQIDTDIIGDFNHYYRTEEGVVIQNQSSACDGPHCLAWELINWPFHNLAQNECANAIRIGMIDTGINEAHVAFQNKSLEFERFDNDEKTSSRKLHGTAVAAVFLGDLASRSPGLLPDATLVAIDPFYRGAANDDRSSLFSLVKALDRLSQREVSVINLSLAGPENVLLDDITKRIIDQGVMIVASVGNAGSLSKPLYPAAYDHVIAVTAVDHNKQIYRRAVQGVHVDVAAPGVNIWAAASIRGARAKTGTSFAAPFVTATVAVLKAQNPSITPKELSRHLFETTIDLGKDGRDEVFGHGLINAANICGVKVPTFLKEED